MPGDVQTVHSTHSHRRHQAYWKRVLLRGCKGAQHQGARPSAHHTATGDDSIRTLPTDTTPQAKSMVDLMDGTPFAREDIITIQDPSDGTRREISRFSHVTENLDAGKMKDAGSIRHNDATARVLSKLSSSATEAAAASVASAADLLYQAKGKTKADVGGASGACAKPALAPRWLQTTGEHAAGFTSTACTPTTRNEIAPLSEEEANRQRCARPLA